MATLTNDQAALLQRPNERNRRNNMVTCPSGWHGAATVTACTNRAVTEIGDRLQEVADDSSEFTYMLRPQAFLLIGHLDQLLEAAGGHHYGRVRSFELCLRQLHEPESVTFDELLARAEWHVTTAETNAANEKA